jgi:hypothetical protein
VEHTAGNINCGAGYEFAIARQAVALNTDLKLYGLQWGAPSWVGSGGSLFTPADITYLLDWLGCARRSGLTISYLGGWNERDNGSHASWFHALRLALNAGGYPDVQIIAGDGIASPQWVYPASPDVAIMGAHDNCGYPTGAAGGQTACTSTAAAQQWGKPLWGSELGAMDAGAQTGCTVPCAPAMDRAFTREYIDARTAAETATGQQQLTPPHRATLAQGRVPFAPGTWHTLAQPISGTAIAASVDGQQVASLTDATLTHGIPGIEAGGWYPAYFSNLTVTTP